MNKQDNNIWIGVEDLSNDPQFLEQAQSEFFELPIADALAQDGAVIEKSTKGTSRRDFLKYTGFSLGAATIAASCEIPVRKAIPYVVKPDAIVPGVAAYYASTYVRGGDYCSILVKTREGRPIKIEGNTLSSVTQGGTSARVQASVLDLYDTARLRGAGTAQDDKMKEGKTKSISWSDLDKEAARFLKPDARVRVVTGTNMSPSMNAAMAEFKTAYTNAEVVTYDAVSASGMLLANELDFGKKAVPSYKFDQADKIVSFGADFLGTWISPIQYAADFAKTRKNEKIEGATMSRFYMVESFMSLTGSNADHRVVVKPSEMGAATLALYNALAGKAGKSTVNAPKLDAKTTAAINEMANDLWASQGKSLVVSGSNDVAEQTVVNAINDILGSYGATIDLAKHSNQRQGVDADMQKLVKDMNAGNVDAVIVMGDANPAYTLPNADQFAAGMKKVNEKGFTVSTCGMYNETSATCKYYAPDHHYLESWGDAEPVAGSYSLIQPTINPLFDTRSSLISLLTWAGNSAAAEIPADTTVTSNIIIPASPVAPEYEYIKNYWIANLASKSTYSDAQAFWDNTLHDGILETDAPAGSFTFGGDVAAAAAKVAKPVGGDKLEVAFFETVNIGDGTYSNNPWLQEMPDPVTRTVWDNALCIPVTWSKEKKNNYTALNNLKDGDVATLTVNGQEYKLPVVRMFGMKENTVAIALGYGRTEDGAVGTGTGTNMYPALKGGKDGLVKYYATGASLTTKQGRDKDFACVQHHHTMGLEGDYGDGDVKNVDEEILAYQGSLTGRSIIHTTNLNELVKDVEDLQDERKEFQKLNSHTLYPGYDKFYDNGHHWSMAVDLSACIGCGACTIACMSENNVPVVGKSEVSIHHEMAWIRIDRYYYGDVENPNVVYQPMMCQHCDNAPCENVCPVAATNHSSEGLNQMTYNRCIGTRYCANNCPYKVRRFNWLDYTTADIFPWNEPKLKKGDDEAFGADALTRMVLNPDVTVRSRGVIEKCSFCVQRIQENKLTAKVERRKLRDGEVKTACQTACPTGAIIFGDDNDKNSKVSKAMADKRNYTVLEEVNTDASVNYWMKVTNKNEKLS